MASILKDSRGMALILMVFVVAILLSFTGASLLFSQLNLKATGNYQMGTAALEVADAGVQHAMAVIPAGPTFPYSSSTQIIPSIAYPSMSGYSYSVAAVNTAGNTQAVVTSTALGPNGTKKVVVAYVGRMGLGAIYLPGSAAYYETEFQGNAFAISGNDTNVNGSAGPGRPVSGIATTDQALVTTIVNSLTSNQADNITGTGGAPSVRVVTSLPQTVSQIADSYLSHPHVDLPGGHYSGNGTWGTDANPQITRITGDVKIDGTISGSGVLIVDGEFEAEGNFTFHGLVIVRGHELEMSGNAKIFGMVMMAEPTTQEQEVEVKGNATVYYSSQALGWVDANWPAVIPLPTRLLAWQERLYN